MEEGATAGATPALSARRHPDWLKVPIPGGPRFNYLHGLLSQTGLHTVCEEARCPNVGECWGAGVATFMILGDICTRRCGYCAVITGRPKTVDWDEPRRVAEAVARLGLRYVVVTSVTRDDLPDGGAAIFAAAIRAIREHHTHPPRERGGLGRGFRLRGGEEGCACGGKGVAVEVLTPDFNGSTKAIAAVLDARPAVFAHNIETVERLFHRVRPKGSYRLSLAFLQKIKELDPGIKTKSGFMVGLGETESEAIQTMADLRAVGCDFLTVGQYLQPTPKHLPVARYYAPEEFTGLRERALAKGFAHVEAGPLVRSSYRADRLAVALER